MLAANCGIPAPKLPGIDDMAAIFSRSSFSWSMRARSALVMRGLRVVDPPREPGPESGVPVRPGPPSTPPLPPRDPVDREVPPRLPRPRARLGAPSALMVGK